MIPECRAWCFVQPQRIAAEEGLAERLGTLPPVRDFTNREGLGVEGLVDVDGTPAVVVVGRPALLEDRGVEVPTGLRSGFDDATRPMLADVSPTP